MPEAIRAYRLVNDTLATLVAKQEIYEVVARYCRGIDRMDLELVRSAYHLDALDHHTGFDGTIDEYLPWVRRALTRLDGTMHVISNHLSEVRGDRAIVETYGTAAHWGSPADDPRLNFTSGSRFVDRMERRESRWAIVERWTVREWTRSDVGLLIAREGSGPTGSRDNSDPLHVARAWDAFRVIEADDASS